jgi:hypothetical protein
VPITVLAAKAAFVLSLALSTHSNHPLDAAVVPTTNQAPAHVLVVERREEPVLFVKDGALD